MGLASPTAVVFAPRNVVVETGTLLVGVVYVGKILSLAHHAPRASPQDTALQLTVRESVCDQYSTLTANVFKGIDRAEVPYDDVDSLMAALGNSRGICQVPRKLVGQQSCRFHRVHRAMAMRGDSLVCRVRDDPSNTDRIHQHQVGA